MDEGAFAVDDGKFADGVLVDDLPEEGDFAGSVGSELLNFLNDSLNGAGSFWAAGLGDDAVTTVHVAALHNANEGRDLLFALKMGINGILRAVFGFEIDNGVGTRTLTLQGGDNVFEVFGNAVKFLCADDKVEVGKAFEQFGSAILGHAAHNADDKIGLFLFACGDVPGLANGLLFGLLAHAAGVQQDHVGVHLLLDDAVPLPAEHGGDGLRIAFVHLAAVGLNEYPVHRNGQICCAWPT